MGFLPFDRVETHVSMFKGTSLICTGGKRKRGENSIYKIWPNHMNVQSAGTGWGFEGGAKIRSAHTSPESAHGQPFSTWDRECVFADKCFCFRSSHPRLVSLFLCDFGRRLTIRWW